MELTINCDGGSRGNPGKAAAGFVIRDSTGKVLAEEGIFLGMATNNEAEYEGLIRALVKAASLGGKKLKVIMDSELVVRQMTGRYRVKAPALLVKFKTAMELERNFESVSYEHVLRSDRNQARADWLVNRVLDRIY
jgi:ribonuclease HI